MRLTKALGDPVLLLAAFLAGAGLVETWNLGRRAPGLDFHQFWVVAQVVGRADVPNVYGDEERARIGAEFVRRSLTDEDSERRRAAARPWQVLEPTATPLLYAAFRPLSGGSYEGDFLVFRTLSLIAVVAGVMALALLLGHSPATALLLLAGVTLAFRPLKTDVHVGNVNAIQLGVVAGYLWLSSRRDGARRQLLAGALLAVLVLFKPNLLAVLPLLALTWTLHGRHRKLALQAAGALLGGFLALALTAAVFGSLLAWRDWLEYLRALPPAKIPLRYGNVGLERLIDETTGLRLAPWLAVLFTGIALACVWAGRPRGPAAPDEEAPRAAAQDTAAVASGCLVYLLSAPMVWLHYLLLGLPAAMLLLRGTPGGGPASDVRRLLAALALLAIAVDPVADLALMYDMAHQAVLTSAGLLVLFGLTARELARP